MKIEALKNKINFGHVGLMLFIFIVAAMLRLVGIGWGMPYNNLHPDEGLIFSKAYQCALDHDFEVKTYYRPNHVLIKLNTLIYIGIQELYFSPKGETDFAVNYEENFSLFTTASRILVALFSMGIVIVAYYIALFWGKRQACLATMLFAVFPSFIEHSHYITPDIPLLFFLMCVLLTALYYHKKPSLHLLFWMSFFTALAICEKYTGAYGCAIIFIAVCVTQIKKPLMIIREGLWAILFLLVGILAISPVLLVDFKTVLEVMAGQNKQYHIGADGLNFGQTVVFYVKTTAVHMGLILTVSSLYGIVKSFKKNSTNTLILLVFLAYILPISILKVHWERYTLPIYAVGLLFGTFGIFYIIEDLQGILKKSRILSIGVYCLLVLLPVGSLMAGSVAVTGSFVAPDSRIFLQDVFAKMNVTTANTVYDCNTPLDPGGFYGAFNNFEAADPSKYKYGSSPKFIMTSSAQRDLFLEADPNVYGWIAEFYKKLDENYHLVYLFEVEKPSYHFLELQNIWYAARSVYRYKNGAANGYEIRLYQLLP